MLAEQDSDPSLGINKNDNTITSMNTLNRTLMALALAGATLTAIAQNEQRPQPPGGPNGGPGGPNGGRPRMASPLMEALDTNRDGTLDAGEIKNAAAALLKLDKDGDGKLTQEELRPARPQGGRGPGGPGGNPGGGNPGGGQHRRNKKNFQHRRPKGPPQGSPGPQGGGNGGA